MSKTVRNTRKADKPRKKYKREYRPVISQPYFEPVRSEELAEYEHFANDIKAEDLELGRLY